MEEYLTNLTKYLKILFGIYNIALFVFFIGCSGAKKGAEEVKKAATKAVVKPLHKGAADVKATVAETVVAPVHAGAADVKNTVAETVVAPVHAGAADAKATVAETVVAPAREAVNPTSNAENAPTDLTYSKNPASFLAGSPITPLTPSSGGGVVASYSISPALAEGLHMDLKTGIISGSPVKKVETSVDYTVTATNTGGSAQTKLTINLSGGECVDTATIAIADNDSNLASSEKYLFFRDGNGYGNFNIYDISTPSAPVKRGSIALQSDTSITDGKVKLAPGGKYAYIYGGGSAVQTPGRVFVIDITDPSTPVSPTTLPVGVASASLLDISICGNMAYAATREKGLAAFDLSDPGVPVFKTEIEIAKINPTDEPSPNNVLCWSKDATTDYIYLGDGASGVGQKPGMRLFDYDKTKTVEEKPFTARGSYLVEQGTLHYGGGNGVALSATLLYLDWGFEANDPSGLGMAIFDISDRDIIKAPINFHDIYMSYTAIVSNDSLLFTGYIKVDKRISKLGVFDISTPNSPTLMFSKAIGTDPLKPDVVKSIISFTSGSKTYLGYTTQGGNAISICELKMAP
jgi:hypothetical protein